MGCGSSSSESPTDSNNNSKKTKKSDNDDTADPEDEEIAIEAIEDGYPPPKPPHGKKEDIFRLDDYAHIDKRARETPIEYTSSWTELIDYLTQGCNSDLEKLRSLFIWLGTLNFDEVPKSNSDEPESLQAMIPKLRTRKISYAVFFAYLCRAAELPCVLVRGYGKSAIYEAGDPVEKVQRLYNIWNAVYVDKNWRFVVPFWACVAITGHSTGKYTLVESKGTAVRTTESAAEGRIISTLNEHYFLTNPEELVMRLLAIDPKWQLLDHPYNLEKFCSIPSIRQAYFENDLEIKSEFNGCLYSNEGACEIVINARKPDWDGCLDYELYFNNQESEERIPDDLQLDRYVYMGRQKQSWTFIVRFPVGGVYKITFNGGPGKYDNQWICDFKLLCEKPEENVQPLPCDPGILGFGPTKELERTAGLGGPSQTNGIVIIKKEQNVNFSFNIKRKVSIRTELVHNEISSQVLQQHVIQKTEKKKLQIDVNVPQDGEYALRMYAKNKETNVEENVCNYLLTAKDLRRKRKTRENPTERKARENLKSITDTANTPRDLEEAIEKCEKLHLDDKGDLAKAHERKTFLQLREDLRDAIKRRHIETLEKAIAHAKESECANDLQSDTEKAEHLLEHLRRLKGFLHDILELKQSTVSEIRSYNHAQPITYHIMKATCMLLGDQEQDLEDWESVKILIGALGKQSLMNRIRKFDFSQLSSQTVHTAEDTIKDYDKEKSQTVSAGVGTFYVWSKNVCEEFNRTNSSSNENS